MGLKNGFAVNVGNGVGLSTFGVNVGKIIGDSTTGVKVVVDTGIAVCAGAQAAKVMVKSAIIIFVFTFSVS